MVAIKRPMILQAAPTASEYWWIGCGRGASGMTELKRAEATSLLAELVEVARNETLTLIYSAKDQQHEQAVVLKQLLDRKLRQVTAIRTACR